MKNGIPATMRTAFTYSQRNTTTNALGVIGLIEYLNNLPLYLDAFYQLYTWSRILRVDVHIECINNDGSPYDFVLGVIPFSQIATITVAQLKETQGSVIKSIGGTTGQSNIVIRKSYNPVSMMKFNMGRNYAMTLIDARNTTYLDTALPVLVFVPSIITGAAVNGISITATVRYHVEFFERAVPALSTLTGYPQITSQTKTDTIEEKCQSNTFIGGVKSLYSGNLWPDVPIPTPDVDERAINKASRLKNNSCEAANTRLVKFKPNKTATNNSTQFENQEEYSDGFEIEVIDDGVESDGRGDKVDERRVDASCSQRTRRHFVRELDSKGDDLSRKPLNKQSQEWFKKQC